MNFFLAIVCISATIFLSYQLLSISRLKTFFGRNAIAINQFRQLKTDDEKQVYLKQVGIRMIKDSADYAIRFFIISSVYFFPAFIYQWGAIENFFYAISTILIFTASFRFLKIINK